MRLDEVDAAYVEKVSRAYEPEKWTKVDGMLSAAACPAILGSMWPDLRPAMLSIGRASRQKLLERMSAALEVG